MRFRMGIVMGFGAGYYLGAKAGRARYEQLNAMLRRFQRSDAYEMATAKASEAAHSGMDKAKGFVEEHTPGHDGSTGGQTNGSERYSSSR
jgi:hypothetical protein